MIYLIDDFWLTHRKLKGVNTNSLFFYLAHELKLESLNTLHISNKTIREEFGINKQNLSRSLKVLKKLNLIKEISTGYLLNPDFVWAGPMERISEGKEIWDRENKKTIEST